jgi:hypothetical protein
MLRRYVCAAVVVLLIGSIALADTLRGLITSASDTEVKITVRKKGEKKGKVHTLKVGKKTEVYKAKSKDDVEKASIDQLKEAIEKSPKSRGVFGSIDEDDGTATKITYFAGKRKKGKPKEDK